MLGMAQVQHELESSSSHGVEARVIEDVLAFACQHAHIFPFLKIDRADRAHLAVDRLGKRVHR